ncbi:MAG: TrmH family RNA methyltransferase [bacterium]
MGLTSAQIRNLTKEEAEGLKKTVKRKPICLVLEDVYDTYNIGGFFRLAEALAVEKIYLCGISETPPNAKIRKSSIGTDKIVPWEYRHSAVEAIEFLKKEKGAQIIAVEQDEKSVDYRKIDYCFPAVFVFGSETYGIKPETLAFVDVIAEIPMFGLNKSLNAMVSAGIALYEAMKKLQKEGGSS